MGLPSTTNLRVPPGRRAALAALAALTSLTSIAGLSASAHADSLQDGEARAIGGGYELYSEKERLRVRKGNRSAPLGIGGDTPAMSSSIELEVAATKVTLSFMPMCETVESTYTHVQLDARLDHEEGAGLLRKGKHAAAEKLFARAASLDPTFEPAAHDHAVALVKLGRLDEAIAVMAPRIKSNPMGGYVKLLLDRPLAPLLGRKGLAHLRAAAPGVAKLSASFDKHGASLSLAAPSVARAPGGALAFVETTGSHGACFADTRLVIRDGKSLAKLAELPLVGYGDYEGDGCDETKSPLSAAAPRNIRARVAVANKALAALGFSPADGEGAVHEEPRPGVHSLRFPQRRQSLVIGEDGAARLFEGGKLLVERPPNSVSMQGYQAAVMIPSEQRILFTFWGAGCHHEESIWVSALSLQ